MESLVGHRSLERKEYTCMYRLFAHRSLEKKEYESLIGHRWLEKKEYIEFDCQSFAGEERIYEEFDLSLLVISRV